MKVHEVMNSQVVACPDDASISQAAQIMWKEDCGIVPVVEKGTRIVCGVLTDRDACMASLAEGKAIAEIPVTHAMSRSIRSCAVEDDLERVHRKMKRHRVHRVLVMDRENQLLGVLSIADLAREAVLPHSRTGPNAKRDVAETLAEIEGPRSKVARRGSPG